DPDSLELTQLPARRPRRAAAHAVRGARLTDPSSSLLAQMARAKLRSRREVIEQIRALSELLEIALGMLPGAEDDPAVIEALWQAEGLGMLCWALGLVELEPFDKHFDPQWLLGTQTAHGTLRARA